MSARFRTLLRTTAGRRFYGFITEAPVVTPSEQFVLPRLILNVAHDTDLPLGTTIDMGSQKFVLGSNGVSSKGRTYRLVEVDRSLLWARDRTTKDTVTGLAKKTDRQALGNVWCALEPIGIEMGELKVGKPKFRLFTGAVLEVNDWIDDYKVEIVEEVIGLRRAIVG